MKGTVTKVARTANPDGSFVCSAKIARTEPPPPEEVDLLDIPLWAYEDFRAAQAGGNPVEITQDEGGAVLGVAIG